MAQEAERQEKAEQQHCQPHLRRQLEPEHGSPGLHPQQVAGCRDGDPSRPGSDRRERASSSKPNSSTKVATAGLSASPPASAPNIKRTGGWERPAPAPETMPALGDHRQVVVPPRLRR